MITDRDPFQDIEMGVEDGKLYVRTTHHNDAVLANNQAHRNFGTFQVGNPAPLNPKGAEVIHMIQAPATEWARFCKKHRDLHRRLHSRSQPIREKAAMEIKALHPEWFLEVPRTMVRGI